MVYRKRNDPPGLHECSKCGLKPESDFYRTRGYLMAQCKDCWNQKVQEFARTERGLAMRRRVTKKYRETPKGQICQLGIKKRHRKKILARGRLNSAVRRGKLRRLPCEMCGEPKTEGHHLDYDKPLEVIWLCKDHHTEAHVHVPA